MTLLVLPHMVSRQSPVVGMEDQEFADVTLFRERVEKLAASQAKYQGIPVSSFSRSNEPGLVAFDANTPDVDEVINLGVKFRFFYANKEPTRFQKILTKVRRRVQDEWACNYMDWITKRYKDAMQSSPTLIQVGCPIPNWKIIDLWFNSDFFHSEPSKRVELQDVHKRIGSEAPSLFQLYAAITQCSSYIKMLYAVVHRLGAEHQFIYSPNHHFRQSNRSGGSDV